MQVGTYLKLSVAVALATIALKGGAWAVTGSVSLLSDALESLVNLAGAMFALWMVSVAARPPDEEHPFGHHKAEYFSSGFEGVLILGAAVAILYEAGHRLFNPQPVQQIDLGLALAVASSALNGGLAWSMLRKSREVHSVALEADARHLFTDVVTSAGVVAGLVGVMLTGWLWLDPVLAMLVGLNIVREGWQLLRRSADGLMDHAVEPEMRERIDGVLAAYRSAPLRVDHVITRRAGARRFVDLHLHMPAEWTLAQAAALRGELERALMAAVPGLRASIQMLPSDVEAQLDDPGDVT